MRPLQSLTFDAVRDLLVSRFRSIKDRRSANRVTWLLPDVLLSSFAMLFFQHPSLLQYQRRMKQQTGRCNLETVFGVRELPSDSQMREILDGIPTEPLRALLPELFERMRRTGWTSRFVTEVGPERYYTMLLDGSEYFHSTAIECPGCLRRLDRAGERSSTPIRLWQPL